jgi:hypothetical protein
MKQRYYDPVIGRFDSVDAITALQGGPQHFNSYDYAYNNPYKFNDPDGRCPSRLGFVVGAGLEITRQILTGEIKDTSTSGLLKKGAQIHIARGSGALGAGIGTQVARLSASIAVRAAANGVAGAAINSGATVANNLVDGKQAMEGVGTNAAIGGVAGSLGSLAGDGVQALRSAANASARGASSSISLANRNLLDHVERTTQSGSRAGAATVGVADAAAATVSNSGGVAESCGANKQCN